MIAKNTDILDKIASIKPVCRQARSILDSYRPFPEHVVK